MNGIVPVTETEAIERQKVVAEARTWIGTPYISNGCVKGAGVDCGMLLIAVYSAVRVIDWFDPRPYPAQWALHQRAERYLMEVERWGCEVETPLMGDTVLFKFGHCWAHGAIISDWPHIIHANPTVNYFAPCREEDTSQNSMLMHREKRFFSPKKWGT